MNDKIKVALVDDNLAFLEGIEALLETDDRYEIIGRFTSGKKLLEFKKLNRIELLLLDVEMPEMNGIQTAKLVNFEYPRIKIVAITMYQDIVYLTQLIESGFIGFVNKTNVSEELFSTLEKISNGDLCFPESLI